MSSIWDVTFAASGELDKLVELKDALPSFFNEIIGVEVKGGVLVAEVAKDYGGSTAIEAVIHRYPDLSFTGMMIHRDTVQQSHVPILLADAVGCR